LAPVLLAPSPPPLPACLLPEYQPAVGLLDPCAWYGAPQQGGTAASVGTATGAGAAAPAEREKAPVPSQPTAAVVEDSDEEMPSLFGGPLEEPRLEPLEPPIVQLTRPVEAPRQLLPGPPGAPRGRRSVGVDGSPPVQPGSMPATREGRAMEAVEPLRGPTGARGDAREAEEPPHGQAGASAPAAVAAFAPRGGQTSCVDAVRRSFELGAAELRGASRSFAELREMPSLFDDPQKEPRLEPLEPPIVQLTRPAEAPRQLLPGPPGAPRGRRSVSFADPPVVGVDGSPPVQPGSMPATREGRAMEAVEPLRGPAGARGDAMEAEEPLLWQAGASAFSAVAAIAPRGGQTPRAAAGAAEAGGATVALSPCSARAPVAAASVTGDGSMAAGKQCFEYNLARCPGAAPTSDGAAGLSCAEEVRRSLRSFEANLANLALRPGAAPASDAAADDKPAWLRSFSAAFEADVSPRMRPSPGPYTGAGRIPLGEVRRARR
jgi:hypothetical protein